MPKRRGPGHELERLGVGQARNQLILDEGREVVEQGALLATVLDEAEPEHCVAVDMDPGCTHALHEKFTGQPMSLVEADLMETETLPDRLGAFGPDLTLACGLIHHLALARSDGLERALDVVSRCAGERPDAVLIVEWIPPDDPQLRSLYDNGVFRSPRLDGYTLDALRGLLAPRWSVTESALPGTGRRLLRCERVT